MLFLFSMDAFNHLETKFLYEAGSGGWNLWDSTPGSVTPCGKFKCCQSILKVQQFFSDLRVAICSSVNKDCYNYHHDEEEQTHDKECDGTVQENT